MRRRKSRRSKSSAATNFWPGYVDALTNVVLNLLFLVALFGITIAVFNQIPQSKSGEARKADTEAAARAALAKAMRIDPAMGMPSADDAQVNSLAAPSRNLDPPELALTDDGDVVIADAYGRRGGPDVAIARRIGAGGRNMLIFTLPGGADPVGMMKRPSVEAALARSFAEGDKFQLWAAVDITDPKVRRIAYLALITLRNQMINNGISSNNIEVRVLEAAATPAGGLRLFLASTS